MTTATLRPGAAALAPLTPPPPPPPAVRPARDGEEEPLARTLAAAFHDDALMRWAFPDGAHRARVLPAFFRVHLAQCLAHDGVMTTDALDGALLFLPPGVWENPTRRDTGAARALDRAVDTAAHPEAAHRLAAITRLQQRRHPVHRPHYYLAFIGVRPVTRHTRTAAALLAAVTTRIDADGQAAYAETSSPGGAHLCATHGFTRFGEAIALPGGGPRLRPMWRGPR
ncbi:hypothetical protein ACFXDE_33285 [Kitasatospora sp. NPDC059408]|uniref:hypothetical protein n=1 Tax=Kitasatospora sp. NPDC059408 TaxID=3346823 RepID=UPI0036C2D9AA